MVVCSLSFKYSGFWNLVRRANLFRYELYLIVFALLAYSNFDFGTGHFFGAFESGYPIHTLRCLQRAG